MSSWVLEMSLDETFAGLRGVFQLSLGEGLFIIVDRGQRLGEFHIGQFESLTPPSGLNEEASRKTLSYCVRVALCGVR